MLIGVDGNEANVTNRVGIGQFAYQVLKQFYHPSSKHRFRIYLKDKPAALASLPEQPSRWQYRLCRPRPLWTQVGLPINLYQDRPQLFFSPTHYGPRFCPVPSVISVMDLSYLFFPDQFRKRDLWQLKRWTRSSLNQAARVIVISESTRRDVITRYACQPEEVVVAYPGYDQENYHPKVREEKAKIALIKTKYRLKGDYLISVGTLQPRKNYPRLIEAFARLISHSQTGLDLSLVIVGKRGWLEKPIFQKVQELGLEDQVLFTGFVPDKDLPYLVAGAQVFVQVSLYEGFGIPVLEAQAVGVPVVLADSSSLPEVGGQAAVYLDPKSPEEIKTRLAELLASEARQARLRQAGYQNVKRFSWESCARKILNSLESVPQPK